MSIQTRYQNSLSDMIILLQEAVYRYINELQVDLSKFVQFFKQFYRNLISLEDNFHPNKTKYSKNLYKLHQLTQQIQFNTKQRLISLEPQKSFIKSLKSKQQSQIKQSTKSKQFKHDTISKPSVKPDKTQELNVIGQIQQRQDFDDVRFKIKEQEYQFNQTNHKNRIGTAQGSRHKMSVTIDFHNTRPYTGSYTRDKIRKSSQKLFNASQPSQVKQRYRSLTKYEKVTNQSIQNGYNDQPNQPTIQKKIFNVTQRKSIYDVLQEQKKSKNDLQTDEQFLKMGLVKLPERKKNKSWSRWSFKINKLL